MNKQTRDESELTSVATGIKVSSYKIDNIASKFHACQVVGTLTPVKHLRGMYYATVRNSHTYDLHGPVPFHYSEVIATLYWRDEHNKHHTAHKRGVQ